MIFAGPSSQELHVSIPIAKLSERARYSLARNTYIVAAKESPEDWMVSVLRDYLRGEATDAEVGHAISPEKRAANCLDHIIKVAKVKKQTSVVRLITTQHTKSYICSLIQYTSYYRNLEQFTIKWMNNNLLNVWGGVINRLSGVVKHIESLCGS